MDILSTFLILDLEINIRTEAEVVLCSDSIELTYDFIPELRCAFSVSCLAEKVDASMLQNLFHQWDLKHR